MSPRKHQQYQPITRIAGIAGGFWAGQLGYLSADRQVLPRARRTKRQLSQRPFVLGDNYSIADIAAFPWYGALVLDWGFGLSEFLSSHEYGAVQRWANAIAKRPAVQRGRRVNRPSADLPGAARERHNAHDIAW